MHRPNASAALRRRRRTLACGFVFGVWSVLPPGPALGDGHSAAPAETPRAESGRAGWLVDPRTGCRLFRESNQPGDLVSWSGGCGPDGRAVGHGIAEWSARGDVDRYEGDVANGRPHGRGIYQQANGNRYEGEFVGGRRHGAGTYMWASGERYEGQFNAGKLDGHGVMMGADGTRYEGDFVAGKRQGRGVATLAGGGRYEGDFVAGRFSGRGVLTSINGRRYEGEFVDGKQHGRGVLTWLDGGRYEGEFAQGQVHGRGIYTDAAGKRHDGHFENGSWVGDDWNVLVNDAQRAFGRRSYPDAERSWLAAIHLVEAPGSDPSRLIVSLPGLSGVYAEQGRYRDAESLLRRAVAVSETQTDADAATLTLGLAALAYNQVNQGKLVEAEALYARALPIAETALGADHASVAEMIDGFAEVHRRSGRFREAESLQRRALASRERTLGAEHAKVAQSLNNLALIYTDEQRYAEAEPVFERALSVAEKAYGHAHPHTATILGNFGDALAQQRRVSAAEPMFKRSLAIREETLSPDSTDVADALMRLGRLYLDEGRYGDGGSLVQRAATIRERRLGPDHPHVTATLATLAEIERAQSRYREAETLQRRVLAMAEKRAAPGGHDVSGSLYALAATAPAQGNTTHAEPLVHRADRIPQTRGETLATAVLEILTRDHVAAPTAPQLVESALTEIRRIATSHGIHETLTAPRSDDPVSELKSALERAATVLHGRIERRTLEVAATEAMIRSLEDVYTRPLDEDDARALAVLVAGRWARVGIGASSLTVDGRDYVWQVNPGGPAERAGVRRLDRVLGIAGLPTASIRSLLTTEGQRATLTIVRPNASASQIVSLTSEQVSMPTVEHDVIAPGIGYVRINYFGEGTGHAMRAAVTDLHERGLLGLIIDLRQNPGGMGRELTPAGETILPSGTVIYEFETRYGRGDFVTRTSPIVPTSVPITVLVDEATGSTAEIFAAAIQRAGRGAVVGKATSGVIASKSFLWLPGRDGLLVRTSRNDMVGGLALDGVGVIPDVVHALAADDLDRGIDSQLDRAIQELRRPR